MGLLQTLTKSRRLPPCTLGVVLFVLAGYQFWVALVGPAESDGMDPRTFQTVAKEAQESMEESRSLIDAIEDNQRRIEEAGGDRELIEQLRKDRNSYFEAMRRRVEEQSRVTEEREARRQARLLRARWLSAASGVLTLLLALYFLTDRNRATRGDGPASRPDSPGGVSG